MEVLCGRSGIAHLEIVFSAQLKIALKPSAGMFRSVTFITMPQQDSQARSLLPLVFSRRHILIDVSLRAVAEVPELCFPQDQRIAGYHGIAVFKSKHSFFG